ncbi:TAFII55 protein [Macleaya cordata]|uniref:TAFII55 protein n=1 Tax=Macleaya cordata TaxID=56857 RepID=A0A200R1I3_MACCD|nr:TAFII55 protein [Macleaya cordata]
MEEQFILRVPPSVAERIDRLLSENASSSSSEDKSLDLSFSEDGRTGTFVIGNEHFPASLLDLPGIVESYKTYDDNVLIKTADIGQIIMVREEGDHSPDGVEYRHGLTPPMRDARRRRFRREPDLNPELVQRVEKDLVNIMAGGTAENVDILLHCWFYFNCIHDLFTVTGMSVLDLKSSSHVEVIEQEEDGEGSARAAQREKAAPVPAAQPEVQEAGGNEGEPDRSDTEDSDDSM